MKIVLATENPGKVKEFQAMFRSLPVTIEPQSRYKVVHITETGLSFVENAILKARHASKQCGLPALADDSGLAVDALHGAPGIYSARYAGENATDEENNQKLLKELQNVPDKDRTARFYCVLAYVRDPLDPVPIICQGIWKGRITNRSMGDNGFGYDPLFFIPELNCTSAELASTAKNLMSHRGKAMREFIDVFTAFYPKHTLMASLP